LAIVKSKLLKQLKKNWPNITLSELNKFTEIILSEIKRALRRNERVEIRGFGTLGVRIQKSSIRRNPKTNQKVAVPEKKVIRWKQSKGMFKKINNEK
tara:strand:+ start:6183 stop:6473 length:291 start_codon:yes stop_codon:yes gene_type:complete